MSETTQLTLFANEKFSVGMTVPTKASEALALWLASFPAGTNTGKTYAANIKSFVEFCADQGIGILSVNRPAAAKYRDFLALTGNNAATIHLKFSALRSFYRFYDIPNPTINVKLAKCAGRFSKTLTGTEVHTVLDQIDTSSLSGLRDKAVMSCIYHHALRSNEAAALNVADICLVRQGARVMEIRGKGGKTRYLQIHEVALDAIQDYLAASGHSAYPEQPLFLSAVSWEPKRMSTRAILMIVHQHSVVAGERVTVHSIRASAATEALLAGVPLDKVQKMLGHANISTTQIYDRRKDVLGDGAHLVL